MLFCVQANALDTLSYSGRLVQTNGAPVVGPVNIKADLAYTDDLNSTLCTQTIPGVTLTKGVFHLKLSFDCSVSGKTLNQVLSQVPVNESVAIQITDLSNSKSYSYQAIHSMPFANVASQLVQMGAGDGEFLKWDNTLKKWKPGAVSGATGGTVTNVAVTAPLTVATPTSTPSITLPQATGSQSGYLSSADWNTFNSKEGVVSGGTATQFYRGDKTWQTLDTSAVPENVNLYFTNARALGVPLTGFTTAAGAIVATDSVLAAFGKAQGQINTLASDSSHFLLKDNTDSITGAVNVGVTGAFTITNSPALPTDAANKQYVDTKLNLTGGTLSGDLNLDTQLKLKGASNYVTVKAHATTGTYNFILPQTGGTSGYVLSTDGSGNTNWVTPTVGSSNITDGTIVDADVSGTAAIAQSKIANLTTDLAAKVSTTLNSGNILVGNGSNVATGVAVSGDATLSNTGALTLANTAVTAGTYKSVTVDGKGRVTGGTNPTTLAGYGITDTLVTGVSVTAPITNTGTAAVPLIGMPVATGSVDGYLSSANFTAFNNKQDAINSSSTLTTGSLTSSMQGGLILNPYNTAAGNTGELRFKELAANGTNYTGFKAPDVLGGNVIYTLPAADGSNGQVLTTNSSGGLSWTTAATSSSTLTGDIGGTIGSNTIGAGKVTLTHLSATGTKDNTTYLRGDNTFTSFAADVRASVLTGLSTSTNAVINATDSVLSSLGKLQKQISDFAVSAVGGDLSGNLPNPTVAKIQGRAVSSSAPSPGQVLRFNNGGTSWDPTFLLMGDLKSSVAGNLFPGTGCAVNQTLQYVLGTDSFSCVNIDSLDAGKITTGTIAAARLPSSATYWQAATGGINYGSGSVGIGTATPGQKLDVNGSARIGSTSSGVNLYIDRPAGYYGEFKYMTGGSPRWNLYTDSGAESGSNAGSDFVIQSYNDAGSPSGVPLKINRATGNILMTGGGNVGIGGGATNPQYNIDVQSTVASFALTRSTASATAPDIYLQKDRGPLGTPSVISNNDGLGHISFRGFDGTSYVRGARISSLATAAPATGQMTADLQFFTNDNAADASERMRIKANGFVGIGTQTPSAQLQVNNSSNTGTVTDNSGIFVTSANRNSFLQLDGQASNGSSVVFSAGSSERGRIVYNHSSNFMGFNVNAAGVSGAGERMRIDANGNVGINTISPTQKLEVAGNIQSNDTYYASVSFADGFAVGDYKEIVYASAVGGAGASNTYRIALSSTRGNWVEAETFTTITSHSDPDVWREIPATVVNYYNGFSYRCFTMDANTTSNIIKFRVRAIRPSSDCSNVSTGALPVYLKFSTDSYNGGWVALSATGSGATVTGYRTTVGSEWNMYTGASKNAGIPTITAKEGAVGIGTNNPSYKLDVRGKIMSVNSSGLNSGGDSIGFATEVGDLPGYPASAYSLIKTNSQYIYFSINGVYSSYISAGGTYTVVSDRNKKENFVELDYDDIRQRIDELPLTQWNYKAEKDSIKHIGPMAQDFHRLFGLNGSNDKMIAQSDTSGVALAGVKSLSKVIREQETEIKDLKTKNAELEARLKKIEAYLTRKPASK